MSNELQNAILKTKKQATAHLSKKKLLHKNDAAMFYVFTQQIALVDSFDKQ